MKKKIFASGLALTSGVLGAGAIHGQDASSTERTAVIAAAQELFAAMEAHDGDRLRRLLLPQAVFVSTSDGAAKEPPRVRTAASFIEAITKTSGSLVERMWDPQVQIDGNLAALWAPYDFHRDGKLSHCGYDAFQLVRQDGVWRIAAVSYTMHPAEKCSKPG